MFLFVVHFQDTFLHVFMFFFCLGSGLGKEPCWLAHAADDYETEEGYPSPRSSPNPDGRPCGAKSTRQALLNGATLLASVALGRRLEPHHPPTPPPRTGPRTNVSVLEPDREHPPLAVEDLTTDDSVVGDLITFSIDSLPQGFIEALEPVENKPSSLSPPVPNPRERNPERRGRGRKTSLHGSLERLSNGEMEMNDVSGSADRRRGYRASQLGMIFNI